jgi:nucleotide-binding universal stress UspA family protein
MTLLSAFSARDGVSKGHLSDQDTTGVVMRNREILDGVSRPDRKIDEIVVGLDDGPAAAAALHWAAEQSRVTGARLRVVHAWQLKPHESVAVAAGVTEFVEALSADARARATRQVIETLGDDAADVQWQLDVVQGGPGPVLVDRSHGARLLVLGTQEHTGLHRAVVGSVSHYCLSHADTTVVAVPAPRPAPRRAAASKTPRDRFTSHGPLL